MKKQLITPEILERYGLANNHPYEYLRGDVLPPVFRFTRMKKPRWICYLDEYYQLRAELEMEIAEEGC